MGELLIRDVDDSVPVELRKGAERPGTDMEHVATDLLRPGLAAAHADRAAVARGILARSGASPLSSVALLDEIRNEGR